MVCLRCGSADTNSYPADEEVGTPTIRWCEACGSRTLTDDLPEQPLNLWNGEEAWRTSDIDTERLNVSELAQTDTDEENERMDEQRALGMWA